ncbi:unnamed protein product [Haemonchus placei]|uniref:RidA family protein n=1 Tax=Haemonchus placei TaxID=6290 RepID=A0A0N4W686_HAEPC|nr:unnamed protein product [Haemonchus placei]
MGVPPPIMPNWAIERNEGVCSSSKSLLLRESNLAKSAVFALSYFWLRDMGTVKGKVYELNIGHCSVVQWEQYYRDVCAEHYRRNPPVIGGFGCTVEIDITLVARRN